MCACMCECADRTNEKQKFLVKTLRLVCVCVWIRESFAEMISLTRRSILFGAGLVNKQPAAVASLATGCLNA